MDNVPPMEVQKTIDYLGSTYTWRFQGEVTKGKALIILGSARSGKSLLLHALAAKEETALVFAAVDDFGPTSYQPNAFPVKPLFRDAREPEQLQGHGHERLVMMTDPHRIPEGEQLQQCIQALAEQLQNSRPLFLDQPWLQLVLQIPQLLSEVGKAVVEQRKPVIFATSGSVKNLPEFFAVIPLTAGRPELDFQS